MAIKYKEIERLNRLIKVCNHTRAFLENEYNNKIDNLRKEAKGYKDKIDSLKLNDINMETDMRIECKKCNKYLGEIRDAKLRKGINFLCKECSNILIKTKVPEYKENEFFDTFFKDIFKGI